MKKSSFLQKVLNAPYMLWSVLFIVAPLIMVAYYAFTDSNGNFTFDNIAELDEPRLVYDGKESDKFLNLYYSRIAFSHRIC